jgi:hypothetical protein
VVPKLRVENPKSWPHHRGGWNVLMDHLTARLHAPDGTRLLSSVEHVIRDEGVVDEPWVGFVHQVPVNPWVRNLDLQQLVHNPAWTRSLESCLGLWVLSDYTRRFLRVWNVGVPVARVLMATPVPPLGFDPVRFQGLRPRRLLLSGWHLRDYRAFADLEVAGYERVVLAPHRPQPGLDRLVSRSGFRLLPRVSDDEYDRLLAESLVVLPLFDAAAVTSLVECIVRGTPVLVNPLPAVIEYLGPDYPLYYEDLETAVAKAEDDHLLIEASHHLLALAHQKDLTPEGFVDNVAASSVFQALPTPRSRQRTIRTVDLTVLVCSHSRVPDLANVLRGLTAQDWPGRFEVIVWNNNAAARDAVDAVIAQAGERLDVKLIHSSENYYCMARFAAHGLMRSSLLMQCDDDVVPGPGYLRRFVEAYETHGPDVVLGATGHTFLAHELDEEQPDRFWRNPRLQVSHREWHEATPVHFLHGNSCLIPRHVLGQVLRHPLPDPEFALVDDYWLSFVVNRHLGIPLLKIRADDVMAFAASAKDPAIAMWRRPDVAAQRVRFYLYHMRQGWPDLAAPTDPPRRSPPA